MKNVKLSVIIIGYNSSNSLKSCLSSINYQKDINDIVEVVYVDDGSSDNSIDVFNSFKLKFQKICIKHPNNLGRNFARNSGIQNASGEWCLFVNSSVYLNENILFNYLFEINNSDYKIFTGNINYTCLDRNFEIFLNSSYRAINGLKTKQAIHYYYLLFSNACIKKSLLLKNMFDENFIGYGGSEMETAYRLSLNYKILFIPNTVVTRFNHPPLIQHYNRIESFGGKNLFFVFQKIAKKNLPKSFSFFYLFFNKSSFLFVPFIYVFRWLLYCSLNIFPNIIKFRLIKCILGLSMILGIAQNKYLFK